MMYTLLKFALGFLFGWFVLAPILLRLLGW